jgi:subtilisin-like proprotein convertase family protein
LFWRAGNRWTALKREQPPQQAASATNAWQPAGAKIASGPIALLTQPGNLNTVPGKAPLTNANRFFAYRLSNSTRSLDQLSRRATAVLFESALIDTAEGGKLRIPSELRAQGDPGAYIVQANRTPDAQFRNALKAAGAELVSYIPNNAWLVRASASVAQSLESTAGIQAVLPFEPYYKMKPALLSAVLNPAEPETALPPDATFNVLLFADKSEATVAEIEAMGARILGEQLSHPFGTQIRVLPKENTLIALAGLSGVQMIEVARERVLANDLSRVTMGVAEDASYETNYLGLTGTNVVIGFADYGVSGHPDYTNRVHYDPNFPGLDTDTQGHGTHIAGIIIGDGTMSGTVTNAQGSVLPNSPSNHVFRGKAPASHLFVTDLTMSDEYLQKVAARSNISIFNNSWNYAVNDYDLAAASYDAAVRDAVPEITGSYPILYVFPAGNAGALNQYVGGVYDSGQGGVPDTILSPATAKNVITVGAVEQMRNITNEVIDVTVDPPTTNAPWAPLSDAPDEVSGFSSRGNVGVGIEGDMGRFKPDVVAPGSFVISARSPDWDTNTYYNPTEVRTRTYTDLVASAGGLYYQSIFIPAGAVSLRIQIIPNRNSPDPFPSLPIYVKRGSWPTDQPGGYEYVVTDNDLNTPPDGGALTPTETGWYFAFSNPTSQQITFDIITTIQLLTDGGSRVEALTKLNDEVGPYYRYESGTSLAAGAAAGTLALMQEFFMTRALEPRTNSPALMKALMINGARSVGTRYNFQVNSAINYQGWGMINLANSLHASLTNDAASGTSMAIYDQSPTNALATGDRHVYNLAITPEGVEQPLRITLAWTDPPGNPLASIKLVNDLDLIVTNNETGEIFFGNDIRNGNDYNLPYDTNSVPTVDIVNNVENVYLNSTFSSAIGTNYSIAVFGRRVNVNAVTAHPDNVVQDYALVISSGNGAISNAFTVTRAPNVFLTEPLVTQITNMFMQTKSDMGGVLQNQHVGASSPLLGTNRIDYASGEITLGQPNQWHFYVLTNNPVSKNYTNAAFLTFLPPNLSVPRMGVYETDAENASREEADIDLYVSTDPGLTNLSPVAISNAWKSLGVGGTETIVITNAPGTIDAFYVGVKSEDQRSAEYSILGIVSQEPFGSEDEFGNLTLRGFPVPTYLVDGDSQYPGVAQTFGIAVSPITVRRVIVTNILTHELMGDLITTLKHGADVATLNNHTTNLAVQNAWFVYDDSEERNTFLPNGKPAQRSDGPGGLMDFGGKQAVGQWLMTYVDNAPGHIGTNENYTIFLEKQQDLEDGITVYIEPGACRVDYIDVPPQATNLTVDISLLEGTGPVYMEVCPLNTAFGGCSSVLLSNNVTVGSVTIDRSTSPQLVPTTYYVRTCNQGSDRIKVHIKATILLDTESPAVVAPSTGGPVLIKDDAVTYSTIFITNHTIISQLDLGLLLRHPRVSDLAITLISPNGDRVLVFEDRGNTTTSGLGTFVSGSESLGEVEQVPIYTNDFESVSSGPYGPSSLLQGWRVLSNVVAVVPDLSVPWRSNNILVLADGAISNTIPTLAVSSFRLSYEVTHAPYIVGTVGWWPFDGDAKDIFSGLDGLALGNATFAGGKTGLAFYGDGSATRVVVPRAPELNVGRASGITIEGWIYPASVWTGMPIAQWSEGTNNVAPGLQFWTGDLSSTNPVPGAISAALWGTMGETNFITTGPAVLSNARWQHVALTFKPGQDDSTNSAEARIYLNGVLVATQQFLTNFIPDTTGDLWFGYDPTTFPAGVSFAGGLDEFGLYERVLTDCEIAAIHRAGANGKYGTNALTCPVTSQVALTTAGGTTVHTFVNGNNWAAGPRWETNIIDFTQTAAQPSAVTIRSLDPNVAIDNVLLSVNTTMVEDGLVHFTSDTNVASLRVKYASTPFQVEETNPILLFTNGFERATAGVYEATNSFPGSDNAGLVKDWMVSTNTVTVVSDTLFNAPWTNSLVLGPGEIQTQLPTSPGGRYQLKYSVRGPGLVGWWNGDVNPLNQRAYDLIGGNDGAFLYGATSVACTNAFVTNRFAGYTTNVLYFNGPETNGYSSKIELGDPENLWLTNSFTIEGWILPMAHTNAYGTEQIFFRGDSRQCLDPYFLALERVDDTRSDLRFHIEDGSRTCGVDLRSAGGLITRGETNWQHVAAVFQANPQGTNSMLLYYNGVLVASNITSMIPLRELDPAYSPGIAIGNRSRGDNSEAFRGYIDELGVYARALTAPEIAWLGTNAAGKADMTLAPVEGLARVELSLGGSVGDKVSGNNSGWVEHEFSFTAGQTNMVLSFRPLTPGVAISGVSLIEIRSDLSYLPEQDLSAFYGQDAYGLWTLEIWDTRAGQGVGAAILQQWQLDFKIAPEETKQAVQLAHGIAQTGRVTARGSAYYVVEVPQWALRATNVLLYAVDDLGAAANVGVLYNTNFIPIGPTNTLLWPPVQSGTNILTTLPSSRPPLWVGQPYYLSVTNPNDFPVTFSLGVWFDITTLTNCEMTTSVVGPAGIPRYFQFEVPTNSTPSNVFPQVVSFWLTGANTNLTVVLSQNLPLPDLSNYDYISKAASTNDEIIMLLTNSTPYSITTTGLWYVGVFNSRETNVPFMVRACVDTDTNQPVIIPLALGQELPFFEPSEGPSREYFFEVIVTNPVSALLFELYNLSGNGDLVLQRDLPPTMAPYLRGSYADGTQPEQIVLRPSFDIPDLRGRYYLGVINRDEGPLSYTIRAATTNTESLLLSGQPIQARITPVSGKGPLLSWNSVEGEKYYVQFTTSLRRPVQWTNLATITATTRFATYQVPVQRQGLGFYRIVQVIVPNQPVPPTITVQQAGLTQIRIAWPAEYEDYRLQYTEDFVSWYNWPTATNPIFRIGNEWVTFDDIGPQPRFYRLLR